MTPPQVKLRILDGNKVVEKLVTISELMDSLQQKHTVERSESLEMKDLNRYYTSQLVIELLMICSPLCRAGGGSYISEGQSAAVPQVNITVVVTGKLTGHLKRRYHDQVSQSVSSDSYESYHTLLNTGTNFSEFEIFAKFHTCENYYKVGKLTMNIRSSNSRSSSNYFLGHKLFIIILSMLAFKEL